MPDRKKVFFTTHPGTDRERKNLLFLNLIRNRGSISRAEMVKITDITAVTVSNYVNGYLKKGIVSEGGYDVSSGGRRPELVEINKKWGCAEGIAINEDSAKGVLINLGGEVLADESLDIGDRRDLASLIAEISDRLVKTAHIDKTLLKKIGISVSGEARTIARDTEKVAEEIEERTGVSILAGSAVLCGAYAEKVLNKDIRETSRVIYIYRDTGEGVFIDGEEFYEAEEERESPYAYLRQWDESLSVVNEAKNTIRKGVGTKIVDAAGGKPDEVAVSDIIEAAEEKDEFAVDLIRTAAVNLSVRIAYLINLLRPEAVVIGGGIEKAGDLFFTPLKSGVDRFIFEELAGKVRLISGALGESACVKGGALLAVREVFIEA